MAPVTMRDIESITGGFRFELGEAERTPPYSQDDSITVICMNPPSRQIAWLDAQQRLVTDHYSLQPRAGVGIVTAEVGELGRESERTETKGHDVVFDVDRLGNLASFSLQNDHGANIPEEHPVTFQLRLPWGQTTAPLSVDDSPNPACFPSHIGILHDSKEYDQRHQQHQRLGRNIRLVDKIIGIRRRSTSDAETTGASPTMECTDGMTPGRWTGNELGDETGFPETSCTEH